MIKSISNAEITLKKIKGDDLLPLWHIAYGREEPEWMKWNGPYFKDPVYTWEAFQKLSANYLNNEFRYGIFVNEQIIGIVSAYYEDNDIEKWLEIGIVLYDESIWGRNIGTRAMKLWINHLFGIIKKRI